MQGQILGGRYLVGEELGTGGMGTVFAGQDLRTLGKVAIKLAHPWLARDPDYAVRLRREAEISASLQSQRIVRIIDFDWHEGRPFLVMEFLPGPTLADRLADEGRLPWPEAATIALEVARALEAAHEAGVIHRDLSPKNIKLVDGRVKVLDFGIARADGLANLTATGVVLGSPDYCAPERLGGPSSHDPGSLSRGDARSDIYSLGCVLYEMLTGRPPFAGDTHWAVIRAHIADPPPPLPGDVPGRLEEVVLRCLEKHPNDRYSSATLLAADLRAMVLPEAVSGSSSGVVLSETMTDLNITRPMTPGLVAAFEAATQPGPAGHAAPAAGRAPVATPPPVHTLPSLTPPVSGAAAWTAPPQALPARRRRPVFAVAAVAAAVVLVGAGAVVAAGRRGSSTPGGATAVVEATATATAPASPTPVPTAAPALISNLKLYHAGDDFSADRPSTELITGRQLVLCYGYAGTGPGTLLSSRMDASDGATAASPQEGAVTPTDDQGLRCDTYPAAADLAAGQYVALVWDRGEERGRVAFTLAAPPTPAPTPEPTETPTAPPAAPPVQTPRPPVATAAPNRQPAQTAVPTRVQTPVPQPPATQSPATQPPATSAPPSPRATLQPADPTQTPRPHATLVPSE